VRDTSRLLSAGSGASSASPDAGLVWRMECRRRTPLARMAAISWRRWSGVRWAGSSGECGMVSLRVGCAHNGLRLATGSLSGWMGFSGCVYLPGGSPKCRIGGSACRPFWLRSAPESQRYSTGHLTGWTGGASGIRLRLAAIFWPNAVRRVRRARSQARPVDSGVSDRHR
jgi:hypothetical protein